MAKLCGIEEKIDSIICGQSNLIPPNEPPPMFHPLSNAPPSKTAHIVRDIPVPSVPLPSRTTENLAYNQSASYTDSATPAGLTIYTYSIMKALLPKRKKNRNNNGKRPKSSLQTHSSSQRHPVPLSTAPRPIRNIKPLDLPPILLIGLR
ncbi:hypothetical protein SNEBB_008307 [Seison nebaliae]|nr:hypothetical protein SNEBB_008307 [Seison nebaliae]